MRALTAILLIMLLVLQYDLWVGEGSVSSVWRLKNAMRQQEQDNQHLVNRNRILEAEVHDLKQGLEAIEERARNEMGMIGKGETFFQIVEQPQKK
jgi:cell division protein FtsB